MGSDLERGYRKVEPNTRLGLISLQEGVQSWAMAEKSGHKRQCCPLLMDTTEVVQAEKPGQEGYRQLQGRAGLQAEEHEL